MAQDTNKVFLSDEHKKELIRPGNDELFKMQLLDSVDYLARHMPTCEKDDIKDKVKTISNRVWGLVILFIGSVITGNVMSCNGGAKKAHQEKKATYGIARNG